MHWPVRDTLYGAAIAEAELPAHPFGNIWRPAHAAVDIRHCWLSHGPWVPVPQSGADADCRALTLRSTSAGRGRRLTHRPAAASHVASGGTVALRIGSSIASDQVGRVVHNHTRSTDRRTWPTLPVS